MPEYKISLQRYYSNLWAVRFLTCTEWQCGKLSWIKKSTKILILLMLSRWRFFSIDIFRPIRYIQNFTIFRCVFVSSFRPKFLWIVFFRKRIFCQQIFVFCLSFNGNFPHIESFKKRLREKRHDLYLVFLWKLQLFNYVKLLILLTNDKHIRVNMKIAVIQDFIR